MKSSLDDFSLILESAQRIYAFTPERYEDLIDDSNGVVQTRSVCAFRSLVKPSIEFVQNTQKIMNGMNGLSGSTSLLFVTSFLIAM